METTENNRITRQPPEHEKTQDDVIQYQTWYVFKEGTSRYPERGANNNYKTAEKARAEAQSWNKQNPDMDYRLIAVEHRQSWTEI